jgi:predicted ATPase
LLTLTGPSGTGKTRLALQLAAESVEKFRDGVFWVPLAGVRDPELVDPAIAQTVGAKNGLAEHLREKEMLLLLDNFEQVGPAAPGLEEFERKLLEQTLEAIRPSLGQAGLDRALEAGRAMTLDVALEYALAASG